MSSTTSAQPISPKLLKGLGCFPTRFCKRSARLKFCKTHEWVLPCIACQNGKLRCGYSPELACYSARKSRSYHAGFRKCSYTCCACYSPFPMLASAISLNRNRRQPPPCLPKSETDGRKSMAAQSFILTIDGVRPFCYRIRLIVSRRITMRAPFQILAIPYRIVDGTPMYCVFHRADHDQWQFIAGGGEDNETPLAAAKRETFEEGGVHSTQWLGLKSLSYIPVTIISEMRRKHWDSSTYVIPEYTFGFECQDDVRLSPEHTDCVWLTYDEANQKLKWDSNRTALYELNCRLKKANEKEVWRSESERK